MIVLSPFRRDLSRLRRNSVDERQRKYPFIQGRATLFRRPDPNGPERERATTRQSLRLSRVYGRFSSDVVNVYTCSKLLYEDRKTDDTIAGS